MKIIIICLFLISGQYGFLHAGEFSDEEEYKKNAELIWILYLAEKSSGQVEVFPDKILLSKNIVSEEDNINVADAFIETLFDEKEIENNHPAPSTKSEASEIPLKINYDDKVAEHPSTTKKRKRDNVKLPCSAAPVLDALLYAVLIELGGRMENKTRGYILISDFDLLFETIHAVCSKISPTRKDVNRIKAIRRHFEFPPLKEACQQSLFRMELKSESRNAYKESLHRVQYFLKNGRDQH